MDKTHYERRSHEQGNYEITPTYTDQIVVTIKSLATGLTMQVYLDEPTLTVNGGEDLTINITSYTGHFNEEEFMVTWSEGIEVTGLPLIYPYWGRPSSDTVTRVINTENHYYSEKNSNALINSMNLAEGSILFDFTDIPNDSLDATSVNCVKYTFTSSSGTSEQPVPFNPGSGIGPITT